MKKRSLMLLSILVLCACGEEETSSGALTNKDSSTIVNTSSEVISSSMKIQYKITWNDENGNLLGETLVNEGEIPTYTYNVNDTQEWDYTFVGWSTSLGGEAINELPSAINDTTYYAVISKVKQKYTLEFITNGGTEIESITEEYGSVISEPTKPTKEGYRFVSWCSDELLSEKVEWPITLTDDTKVYASWNEQIDVKAYLKALLDGYSFNPLSFVPESMQEGYSANLIDKEDVISDYSNFIDVEKIISNGFGEQWNMVLDNIEQSQVFHKVLSVVETLSSTSIAAFNNYFDKNPNDTADYSFKEGIYTVNINFDGETMSYVLDYTGNIPVFGEQQIQIALSLNIEENEKNVRIQIGDANALAYSVSENKYEFAIQYLNIRKAYFSITKDEDLITGHIKEYLTVSSVELESAADFYITDDYVSVVGNKAGGLIGFDGYICEVYSAENGKMLGYEVRESLSSIVYNTLWFDLNNISGLENIKYLEQTENTEAKLYVNDSSKEWETKKVGGFSAKALSRRFDIEFRNQYFYTLSDDGETYEKVSIKVPMFFVQEENFDTVSSDVKEKNNINISINVDDKDLEQIKNDYATYVDVFIENKENINKDIISEFIGSSKEL